MKGSKSQRPSQKTLTTSLIVREQEHSKDEVPDKGVPTPLPLYTVWEVQTTQLVFKKKSSVLEKRKANLFLLSDDRPLTSLVNNIATSQS